MNKYFILLYNTLKMVYINFHSEIASKFHNYK